MPTTVLATREGLIRGKTASGYHVDAIVPFVALPSDAALRQWVIVTNPANGRSIRALVLDVGPHYTHDNAYVFDETGATRPRAEALGHDDFGRVVTNGAGIDLGEKVWNALGMTDNGPVSWEFATADVFAG